MCQITEKSCQIPSAEHFFNKHEIETEQQDGLRVDKSAGDLAATRTVHTSFFMNSHPDEQKSRISVTRESLLVGR